MKIHIIYFLSFFTLTSMLCQAQKDSMVTFTAHAILENHFKSYTLVDKESGTKFVLDSSRTQITAIAANEKQLWQTDPWKEGRLKEYRVKRPVVVDFYFFSNKHSDNREQIWVVYENTQTGFINKLSGKFTFLGQD